MELQCRNKNMRSCLILLLVITVLPLHAANLDNVDEVLDDSHEAEAVTEKKKGQWVPVPMIISNPTVGSGVQAVLMYLHPKQEDITHNTTTGIVGMYTDTESWFTGVFHDDYWKNDTIRFSGFIGTGEFNLDYYGIGEGNPIGDNPIPYEFDMVVGVAKLQMQVPGTKNWFAGLQYLILDSTTVLRTSSINPGLPDITGKITTAGLGVLATFDTRNNNYYPTDGYWFEAKWLDYSETWGGDDEYQKSTLFINHYRPLMDNLTLALRSRLESSTGDVPFFDLPTLQMSGFARDRYRDQHTISFHIDGRYKFLPRWGVVGFYEFGWFNDDMSQLFSGRRITSYGAGIRWQVVEQQQMHLGIDVAFSTDDEAIYVKIGERF
jgi:hypothetical protein